jgi:hypothetical protein
VTVVVVLIVLILVHDASAVADADADGPQIGVAASRKRGGVQPIRCEGEGIR